MTASLSIRSKLLLISLAPIVLLGAVSMFTVYSAISLGSMYRLMFEKNMLISAIRSNVDYGQDRLSIYLSTKNSDSLRDYVHYAQLLQSSRLSLNAGIESDDAALLERDTGSLLGRFLAAGDWAIAAKRADRPNDYQARFDEAAAIASATRYTIGLLGNELLARRLEILSDYSTRLSEILRLDLILLSLMALMASLIAVFLSVRLTTPIIHLSAAAAQIARADFGGPDIRVESDDEIGMMTQVFNSMKSSLAKYVDTLKMSAEVEARLMEQRLKNLEMSNLLKHAELKSLQARINPHFLFNTMNTGIQLATIEEADRTRIFLENLTGMMRYSVRGLEDPVTLKEEFESIASYIYLISIRFPGRFCIKVSLDPESEAVLVPKLCIQPLVENAIRHGFTEEIRSPELSISAAAPLEGRTEVVIEDNGVGFMPGTIEGILACAASGQEDFRESPGEGGSMGLVNVIQRLRLFTGDEDAVRMDSSPRIGAKISIFLPVRGAEVSENA